MSRSPCSSRSWTTGSPANAEVFAPDLEAYFARTGYTGSRAPTLETLHAVAWHHATSIPFENLDVLLGRGIDIAPAAVERKLVREKRGGYCFEQNSLLLHGLRALGYRAKPLSARVRLQRPRDFTPPRTHLFVRVDLADEPWIVDAGVGSLSLTSAIRFEPGLEQATPHDTRRITQEGGSYFHQVKLGGEWTDVCEFTGEEMPPIDRELANWWTSTNPESKFRQNLMAGRAAPDGLRRAILNHEFTVRRGSEIVAQRAIADPDELLAILAEYFDLHFPAGTRFGPPGSLWPT
ncbi:MAG: N-hydroxyarylamine O-acetyltransferase [Lacunisphaera sp.]|nr:N-hydroxyarylamine O-acetyltransferase [Lacunisphaera sp.]